MSITANGYDVLAMRLTLPVQGIWVATLRVSADEDLSGALTLENDAVKYSGFVLRGTSVSGAALVDAVGGTGGLGNVIDARSYQGASARDILVDLLAAAGEKLDGTSTRQVLSTALPFWTRTAERASLALSSLSDALGARWRVRPSGVVWMGTETWPEMAPDYEAIELDRDSAASTVLLAPETIALTPGVTLRGERVGRVEHVMGEEELRTTFWLETAA
jgi:hypothetical protein